MERNIRESYNEVHEIDGVKYRVRLVRDPLQDPEGKILDTSEFSKNEGFVYYNRIIEPNDLFFEVEEETPNKNEISRLYIGMVFNDNGGFLDGKYWDHFGGGFMMPTLLLNERGNLIRTLGAKLPKNISKQIKDLYSLTSQQFLERLVKTEIDRKNKNHKPNV